MNWQDMIVFMIIATWPFTGKMIKLKKKEKENEFNDMNTNIASWDQFTELHTSDGIPKQDTHFLR